LAQVDQIRRRSKEPPMRIAPRIRRLLGSDTAFPNIMPTV
jgi:hypothetical protein